LRNKYPIVILFFLSVTTNQFNNYQQDIFKALEGLISLNKEGKYMVILRTLYCKLMNLTNVIKGSSSSLIPYSYEYSKINCLQA